MKSFPIIWGSRRLRGWRHGDRVFAWAVERHYLALDGFEAMELRGWDRVGDLVSVPRSMILSTRWKAKDRAWRWYCRAAGRPFASLHKAPALAPHDAARRRAQVLRYRKAVTRGGN